MALKRVRLLYLLMAVIIGIVVGLSIRDACGEVPRSQVVTATDQMLYDANRHESLSSSMNIDAAWDTTATINAGWANRLSLASIIDSDNYILRSIVLYTSDDASIHLYGDGINCKYADADTLSGYLRAGNSITLPFSGSTIVDSVSVVADNASTTIDVWVLAARPKLSAP